MSGLGVEGGFDREAAALEDVGIDHCGFDVFVAEEFLNGANVVVVLEEVGGKGMPEGVRSNVFIYFCGAGCLSYGFLENRFVKVMTLGKPSTRVFGKV